MKTMKNEYIVDIRGQLWQDSSSADKRKVILLHMINYMILVHGLHLSI